MAGFLDCQPALKKDNDWSLSPSCLSYLPTLAWDLREGKGID